MRVSPLIQHWAFLAVFIAAPCLAATEIRVYSEDGDFVGKGGTYVFPEDEGDWIIEGEAHFARISWWNLPQQVFSFTFEDWTSPRLLPGRYDVEVQDSRSPPTGPTMSISGNNSSCSPGVGYYEIYEIETGPDDVITKIAVDAYQRCDNSTRGLFAEVRYNSDIAFDLGVRVRAVDDFVTPPGAPVDVGLDFASSSSGPITTFEWKQVGGDPVALAGADSDTLSFTAPVSDAEYEALVFQITVTDSIGETATDNVTVISSAIGTVSMGYMLKSAPGSYIGGGRTEEAAIDEQYLNIIHDHDKTIVNYEPPDGSGWEMQIAADFGQDLQIGQYNVAHRAPFRPENFPGAAFGITGRGCNSLLADFKVLDIGYADNKAVERLAVDMVLGCLSGNDNSVDFRLRVNSVVPIFSNAPIADPGRDLMALPNDVVHLDAYATQNDFGSIASYEWSQTLGPPVTLFDSGSSVARFVAPDVVQGQGLSRFELTVVNDAGLSDAESVEVNILGTNDRKTYITLESSVPDFRLNRRLDQNTGYLFAHEPQNGFDIHFIALLDWGFAFRQLHDPGNTVPDLLPGLYEQAQRSVPGFPHMYISGAGHGWQPGTGQLRGARDNQGC